MPDKSLASPEGFAKQTCTQQDKIEISKSEIRKFEEKKLSSYKKSADIQDCRYP